LAVLVVVHGHAHLGAIKNAHYDGASAVGALMLRKVVAAGELLAAIGAFEWLVMRVERAIMALEVFLSAETTRAKGAHESFRWILGERLFAPAAAHGLRSWGSVTTLIRLDGIVILLLVFLDGLGAGLAILVGGLNIGLALLGAP